MVYHNCKLNRLLTEEGYVSLVAGRLPKYSYYLNNNRVDMAQNGTVLQVNHYYPFGGLFGEGTQTSKQEYKYNGKELDRNFDLDLYDYGARHYDAALGRWFTVDPLVEKYFSISPYVYVLNSPIKYIDPDGRDAVLVVFPNYMVDTETRLGKQPLGHAGILLIDNTTGLTKYYEYGRYSTEDGTKGRVRNVTVSNVVIDSETGKPTQASLHKVLEQISKQSGQGGGIQGAYVEADFKTMNDYAQQKFKESNPGNDEYDKDRKPYKLLTNSCGTFAADVIKQDASAKKKAPWIINPAPTNIANKYQDKFPKVDHNSKTNNTTSDIYN